MAHVQASRLLVRAEARMRLQQPAAAVRRRGEEGSVGGGSKGVSQGQRGVPGAKAEARMRLQQLAAVVRRGSAHLGEGRGGRTAL